MSLAVTTHEGPNPKGHVPSPPTAPWACIKASGTPLINEINHSTTIPFTFDSNNDDPHPENSKQKAAGAPLLPLEKF